MQDQEFLINTLCEKYYIFSHFVIEEELQAMQLVIDVLTSISLEDREILNAIERRDNEIEIYKRLIHLARKRAAQTTGEELGNFSVIDKAIFYLVTNSDLEHEEICSLVGEDSWQIDYRASLVRADILNTLNKEEYSHAK